MTKRICSLLLTLCLIFSLSTFAFATNGAHKTVDYIAQDWIDTQFSGDAEVSDTIVLDLWSDFKRDVTADKPILLYTSSSAGTAHAQVVVGFWEYTNGGKYVKILSGWTSYPTFLKFKPSSLNNFNGYCVAISD